MSEKTPPVIRPVSITAICSILFAAGIFNIIYTFTGRNLNKSKLEQAIMLSEEKYCSVGATLAGIMKITHSCVIKGG